MKLTVKVADQSYEVEVADLDARPVVAVVDGESFEVWPAEEAAAAPVVVARPAAAPVVKAAPVAVASAAPAVAADMSKSVVSPLPGKVVDIKVKVGDKVKQGQELATVEAMKMKNAIRAGRDGTIAVIHVTMGATVRHGQALVEYTE